MFESFVMLVILLPQKAIFKILMFVLYILFKMGKLDSNEKVESLFDSDPKFDPSQSFKTIVKLE